MRLRTLVFGGPTGLCCVGPCDTLYVDSFLDGNNITMYDTANQYRLRRRSPRGWIIQMAWRLTPLATSMS